MTVELTVVFGVILSICSVVTTILAGLVLFAKGMSSSSRDDPGAAVASIVLAIIAAVTGFAALALFQ
jgi:hypothetical protein